MTAWWGREAWGPLPRRRDGARTSVGGGASAAGADRSRRGPARGLRTHPLVHARMDRSPAHRRRRGAGRVSSPSRWKPCSRVPTGSPRRRSSSSCATPGSTRSPRTPAAALLAFSVSSGAKESVLVPAGFQVGAPPANGQGDLVVFETTREIFAAPATLAELHVQEGTVIRRIALPAGAMAPPFEPFGRRAEAGRALYLGPGHRGSRGASPQPAHARRRRGRAARHAAAGSRRRSDAATGASAAAAALGAAGRRAVEAARGRARRDGRPGAQRRHRARAAPELAARPRAAGRIGRCAGCGCASSSAAIPSRPPCARSCSTWRRRSQRARSATKRWSWSRVRTGRQYPRIADTRAARTR